KGRSDGLMVLSAAGRIGVRGDVQPLCGVRRAIQETPMRGFPHAFSACLVPALLMAALPSLAASPVLVNPSFETPYLPVTSYTSNVSGNLAHGWADLSYGTVSAAYAEQTANPHGGTACQQVTLSEVGANSGFQMGQQITLPGGTLNTPGLWFRGTPGTRLDLVLIQPVS